MHIRKLAVTLAIAMTLPVCGSAQAPAPADSAHIDALITQFVRSLGAGEKIARGAFVVVRDSSVVIARGIGTDEKGRPVDPATTVFRAASNSKLLTATAVMQLVQQGRLTLDGDINRYLPVEARVPATFAAPITIGSLLTHTSGLENRFSGAIVSAQHPVTLATFYATQMPVRAVPPGDELSYSNIGMALAGYIVEHVSSEPFAEYAERHLFAPLGMMHSSFRQPTPVAWPTEGRAPAAPAGPRDIMFVPYPSASLVTSPVDMAQFLIAQLNNGRTARGTILDSATTALMQAPHWRAQPDVPAVAYGFFEGMRNGQRYLFHTGDSGDHSLVLLVPGLRVALYFVFSGGDDQTAIRDRFAAQFLDRFVGATTPPPSLPALDTRTFGGRYRASGYSRSNYEKIRILIGELTIRGGADGSLAVTPPGAGASIVLRRIGALSFRGDSGETISFQPDAAGRPVRFELSGLTWDPSAWNRIAWYERGAVHIAALVVLALAVVLRALVVPAMRVRSHASSSFFAHSVRARHAWRVSGVAALLYAVSPFVLAASALLSHMHPSQAIPFGMRNATVLVSIGETAALVALVIMARVPRATAWPRAERRVLVLLCAASVAALPTLVYVRLLYPLSVRAWAP